MQAAILTFIAIPVFTLSLFAPTIINDLGYKASTAQLMSAPPFAVGAIFVIIVGIVSDNRKLRGPIIIGCVLVGIAGYVVLYAAPPNKPGLSYAGIIIASIGIFPALPVTLVWGGGSAGGDIKRGVSIAMTLGLANLGGVCSSFIYRAKDAPRYHIGHGTVIGSLLLAVIVTCVAMFTYSQLNKQKEIKCREEGIDETQAGLFRDMGDASPLFRYTI